MKKVVSLTEEQRDEVVKQILNDAIINERTQKGINLLQKVSDPNRDHMEFNDNGVYPTFPLMGLPYPKTIEDEEIINPIYDELCEIFDTALNEENKRDEKRQRTASDLADHIFLDWKVFMRDIDL